MRHSHPMILWHDGSHDAGENMRRDAALLAAAEADPGFSATLRLFQFEPRAITLGFAQDPVRELDLARCMRDGVGWAVRPTGGRAILHVHEWTWSLTARIADPSWGGSLGTAFDRVSALIASSLRRLGIPAESAAPRPRATAAANGTGGSREPCFASTARHEITLDGRKLVGSAQRRTASALLQQGSVLLGPGHLDLAEYLAMTDSERPRVRARLAASATDAAAHVGADAALERWVAVLAQELGVPALRAAPPGAGAALVAGKRAPYTAQCPGARSIT